MKKSIFVFLLSLLSFSVAATAKTKKVKPQPAPPVISEDSASDEDGEDQGDVRVIRKDKKVIFEDSSEYNRRNQKYAIWAQLTGVGPSLTGTSGLMFGYYYSSNDILFVEATHGTLTSSLTSLDVNGEGYNLDSKSIGAHWKHFTGNSFYLNTGVDFRSMEYKYVSTFSSTDSKFDGKSFVLSFSIGNQWQWDNFTLGCDWVGIVVPVSSSISGDSITTGSSIAAADFKKDQDTLVKKSHAQLLRFYLGASF